MQQSPGSLKLVVLALQFDGSQPNLLAVGVGLESQRQDTASSWHITLGTETQMMWNFVNMNGNIILSHLALWYRLVS